MSIIPSASTRLLIEAAPDVQDDIVRAPSRSAHGVRFHTERGTVPDPHWRRVSPESTTGAHPWDLAHAFAAQPPSLDAPPVEYVEPDFEQRYTFHRRQPTFFGTGGGAESCAQQEPDGDWPIGDGLDWHLDVDHSQLANARRSVWNEILNRPESERVRIGILDTGYDPSHHTLPTNFLAHLAYDFVDEDRIAIDPGVNRPLEFDQPGHGTATLALLAGKETQSFEAIGGIPFADVLPVRIATSVVHFWTSSMAQGIDYCTNQGCKVISISMGGVPTRRWAQAVNRAYEKGVVVCAAAGNNILNGLPMRELVWPARFRRTVAVCGVTADHSPYKKDNYLGMQGNYGPESAMASAVAAYTPNIAWARLGCAATIDRDGAGTSSATPQVAAACALWLERHGSNLPFEGWRCVEMVRHALYSSAEKSLADVKFTGNGVLRAARMLEVVPKPDVRRTEADRVWFPFRELVPGFERFTFPRRRMFEVEAVQLSLGSAEGRALLHQTESTASVDRPLAQRVIEQLKHHLSSSRSLRQMLEGS